LTIVIILTTLYLTYKYLINKKDEDNTERITDIKQGVLNFNSSLYNPHSNVYYSGSGVKDHNSLTKEGKMDLSAKY
jgi:hypothetical protein